MMQTSKSKQQADFVTCSSVGRLGRFGNSLFQYMFLQCYAKKHGLKPYNYPWVGDEMFEVVKGVEQLPTPETTLMQQSKKIGRRKIACDMEECAIARETAPHINADFQGFFQYHTSYYRPYKALIEQHFAFKGAYLEAVKAIESYLASFKKPVVTLHLRRGDYGYNIFFITPNAWYLHWLEELKKQLPDFVLYIATDDPEAVLPDFAAYNPITMNDLPGYSLSPAYFKDFAAMTLGDYVGISNSSFSFAATMLNTKAKSFMRPCLSNMALIPYEPWNDRVLLIDKTAEEAGDAFVNAKVRVKPRYQLAKIKRFLFGS
jgi:hypothetical protein